MKDQPLAAATVEEGLRSERARLVGRLADMRRDFSDVVEASANANADDEHDPEGATIAYERSQLSSLIDVTTVRLADVDAALGRIGDESYGRCEGCGGPIDDLRLAARPSARLCIACASAA